MPRPTPEYDLCLNAHITGANPARLMAKFFRQAGLKVHFEEPETLESSPRLWAIAHAVAVSRVYMVLAGDGTPAGWVQAELEWGLKRRTAYDDLQILPVLRAGFEAGSTASLIEALSPIRLPDDKTEDNLLLRDLLRDLVARLRSGGAGTTLPLFENEPESAKPFPGLRPFAARDSRFFFGREQEVIEVGQRLGKVHTAHRRWMHLSGPSGIGKTSLVRAGLVPAARRGVIARAPADFIVASLRPARRPIARLAESLTQAIGGDIWVGEVLERLKTPDGLAELVREEMHVDKGLFLCVDHLEDLLGVDPEELAAFDALLSGAIDDFDERLYLVTTTRDDLTQPVLSRLPKTGALAATRATYMELGAPTREGLWEAIVGPVRLAGGRFADGLAERILDDVERTPDPLPRMAHVLSALWDRSWEGELTHATYEALGGLSGALERDGSTLLAELGPEDQRRAHALLLGLVAVGRGRGDTLRVLTREEALTAAGGGPRSEAVLRALANVERGGLLRLGQDETDDEREPADDEGGTSIVSLAHDALLRDWSGLQQLVEVSREALERRDEARACAQMWRLNGPMDAEMPKGPRLRSLEGESLTPSALELYPNLLDVETRRFLEAARTLERRREQDQQHLAATATAADAQHRAFDRARTNDQIRNLRLVIVALGASTLIAVLLAALALGEQEELRIQRNTVEAERRRVEAQREKIEAGKVDADRDTLAMEQRFRDAERSRRAAGRQSARDGQTADDLLRIAMEISATADEAIKRIPGEASKYARRVVSQALSRKLQESLSAAPDNELMRFAAAQQHQIQGDLWAEQKQPRTALTSYSQAEVHLDALLTSSAPLPRFLVCMATVQLGIAELHRREPLSDARRTETALRKASDAYKKLAELEPDVLEHQLALAELSGRLGRLATGRQDLDAARLDFEAGLAHAKRVAESAAAAPEHQLLHAQSLADLAEHEVASGGAEAARGHYDAALALLEIAKSPDAQKLRKRIRQSRQAR